MRSEWREVPVKELGEIVTGKTPRTKIEENFGGTIPFLTPSDNMTVKYVRSTKRTLSKQGVAEVSNKVLPANSIAVSCIGSDLGKVVMTTEETVTNQQINSIIPSEFYDPDFIYYSMKILGEKLNFLSKTSTAVPIINKTQFSNESILVPSLSTQKAIADTLSCLDAKIEVNNRIIKNLEEQAQAIFKNWFIDFEPFQDGEFVESELGMIPEGWKAGTIADLGEVVGGSTPSKKFTEYYSENGIAWITPKDLSLNKNKFVSKGQIGITQLGLKNSSARVMPKGTVLFSSRAPIGYIAIAKNEVTTNQGFKSVVPREDVGTEYVYHFLKNNVSTIEAVAGGSTFKEVSGTTMKQIPALIPSKRVLEEFKKAIHLHFQLQELLEQQNTTLATLRDTLLPKLMSGGIEVPIDQ